MMRLLGYVPLALLEAESARLRDAAEVLTGLRAENAFLIQRAAEAEARLGAARERAEDLKVERDAHRLANERLVDSMSFASGHPPVFHPDDPRYQARQVSEAELPPRGRPGTARDWQREMRTAQGQPVISGAELENILRQRREANRAKHDVPQALPEETAGLAPPDDYKPNGKEHHNGQ